MCELYLVYTSVSPDIRVISGFFFQIFATKSDFTWCHTIPGAAPGTFNVIVDIKISPFPFSITFFPLSGTSDSTASLEPRPQRCCVVLGWHARRPAGA